MSIDVFPASALNSTLWNGQSMPLSIAGGGTGATTAATARTNLGLGTMAQQDAASVAITGGSAALQAVASTPGAGDNQAAYYSTMSAAGGTNRFALQLAGDAPNYLAGVVGIRLPPSPAVVVYLKYNKPTQYGMILSAEGSDAGNETIVFQNAGGAFVGSIQAGATATAYNTSSDMRLKHSIQALTGALDVVQALRPVHFLWNATDEPGEGFLAHELMRHVPAAVTGQPDEVNEDGSIRPQGVDHSRLVPWLTAALQDTLAQVQALTARVATLETALGV